MHLLEPNWVLLGKIQGKSNKPTFSFLGLRGTEMPVDFVAAAVKKRAFCDRDYPRGDSNPGSPKIRFGKTERYFHTMRKAKACKSLEERGWSTL